MDDNKIHWMYEPESFPWQPPKKKYTPDFKIMKKDRTYFYVEYKGYLRPEDRTKMLAFKKQYPDIDIRFVFMNARKPIYKGSKTTYSQWAEKNGFPWAEKELPKGWL
jgi:predicted nuclease of restriction endonuclease-like RecB superfamily